MYKHNLNPDTLVASDDWSDYSKIENLPQINRDRLLAYRLDRIRTCLAEMGASMCVLVNPISLRYAIDYRNYALFQSHIPTTYLFVPVEGPLVLHSAYDPNIQNAENKPGRNISFFDGATTLEQEATHFADDIYDYLKRIGTDNRTVALEYVNPSITRGLLDKGLEVMDGVAVSEIARVIKSEDELACMRWSVAVAQHGIAQIKKALKPGVTELQLWALLNYTNVANDGDWHEGRMLASGPRINPWLQEATNRQVRAGDLVGFDTDMVGPFGYFADISRTLFCGPGTPTRRQKQLYQLAKAEIDHNMSLIKPGLSFSDFHQNAYEVPEEFHENAYVCTVHGVGMCDEYPKLKPRFRGPLCYDGVFETGMVICIESYMGAVGEPDGVKLEQQALITETGLELLTTYPLEEILLD